MTEPSTHGAVEPVVNLPGATKHYTSKTQERKWLLIDAKGQSVGRMSTVISTLLRGKHKPTYTRHDDVGDFVVVINAAQMEFRGNDKAKKKYYYKHTGWFGHLKSRRADVMMDRNPEVVLKKSVFGMMGRGALANRQIRKLKIYRGAEHPHKAQKPDPYPLT